MTKGAGQLLYERARRVIPGGTQLFGKRPELYLPEQWPAYYSRARGCEIWDLDGRRYLDFTTLGIGTSVLGYADPDVETAVIAALRAGNMATLNCPEEVELAELLCELHPWAERVRFARTGGETMAMAVRIARAATGRDRVAICGYHGWHDWYLALNLASRDALGGHLLPGLEPRGVPAALAGSVVGFTYDSREDLDRLVEEHGSDLAAIVMEPARSAGPSPGYLDAVRAAASKLGAVLVFDEITSAWRISTAGIHTTYGVAPDMCSFAKTMSNGVPMAALIGRREVMDHAAGTFISSSYWTERMGPAAALATIAKHRRDGIGEALVRIGRQVQSGWAAAASDAGLPIKVAGLAPLASFTIQADDAAALHTLFTQEMLDRGFLASHQFYASVAHDDSSVAQYLDAVAGVFRALTDALERGDVRERLRGPVRQTAFGRMT